jgi:hypothetical protein
MGRDRWSVHKWASISTTNERTNEGTPQLTVTAATPRESFPLTFNIARSHSVAEISAESDKSAMLTQSLVTSLVFFHRPACPSPF